MNLEEIEIGTQVWMAENLNICHFRNGDPVQEAKTDEYWKAYGEEGKPAWCYYDNDPANGEKYGILYNWYATIDPRGLAPKGWYVPSDKEWTSLIIYLGGSTLAGEKLKFAGKGAKSTKVAHEINFNALPGGYRKFNGGFTQPGSCGFWWSSTEKTPGKAWSRYMYFNDNDVSRGSFNKSSGFSVKCLKG